MATTALYTSMMDRSRSETAATDFTLQQSLAAIGPVIAASFSGFSAAALGYGGHFLVATGVQVAVVLIAAKLLFSVPFVGNMALLLTCILIFVLALVLLGYLISTAASTQMQAMQLTFFFFLPSLLLSGFMFPFVAMPKVAQWLAEILPMTHFLRVIRGVVLRDAPFMAVSLDLAYLLGFFLVTLILSLLGFRQKLD